jgi:hypothetical protein
VGDASGARLTRARTRRSMRRKPGGGGRHMDQLSNQVEHSFLPAQQTENSLGRNHRQADQTSRRRLNTKFVEWLQGFRRASLRSGRSAPQALETWLSRSREHLRCLSPRSNRIRIFHTCPQGKSPLFLLTDQLAADYSLVSFQFLKCSPCLVQPFLAGLFGKVSMPHPVPNRLRRLSPEFVVSASAIRR